jgi:hypothetical protein
MNGIVNFKAAEINIGKWNNLSNETCFINIGWSLFRRSLPAVERPSSSLRQELGRRMGLHSRRKFSGFRR